MKRRYDFDTLEKQRKILRINEILEEQMQGIECDFAQYNISDMGYTLFRIFLYPVAKEFTPDEIVKLKKILEDEFQFKNKSFSKDYTDSWQRDFREEEGIFYVKRYLRKCIEGNTDLYLLIEQSPKLNCRVEKKTVEKEVYEAICE